MEYVLQFCDSQDADIIMGHVMKDSHDGEVQITLLAAGMDPNVQTNPQHKDVFVSQTAPRKDEEAQPSPIQLDELDLDIPTFLRRKKIGN